MLHLLIFQSCLLSFSNWRPCVCRRKGHSECCNGWFIHIHWERRCDSMYRHDGFISRCAQHDEITTFHRTGKEVHPKGLLLHRGRRSCTTGDYSAVVHSRRRKSCEIRRRPTTLHAGHDAGFHQELLSALSTGSRLTVASVHTYLIFRKDFYLLQFLFVHCISSNF